MARPKITIDPEYGRSRGKGRGGQSDRAKRSARRKTHTKALSLKGDRLATTVELVRQGEKYSYIRCRTAVSSTHALLAQLRGVGLRVIGDPVRNRSYRKTPPSDTRLHLERIAIHHPVLKRRMTVSCPLPAGFAGIVDGKSTSLPHLHAALIRRLPLILDGRTDSFRLLTEREEVKGLAADKYGDVVILQVRRDSPENPGLLPQIARWYFQKLACTAVYVKRFAKTGGGLDEQVQRQLHSPEPLVGRRVPEEVEITEHGLRFIIRPYDGLSVGLFLDHRDNRQRVRRMSEGLDVLNLFAYTCGLSLAAAAGGAARTTSVDISPRHLEWGRSNFLLNSIDPAGHQFIDAEALGFLKKARRSGDCFDLIILDPPSFAHGRRRKQSFSIVRDLPGLINEAVGVLKPGGRMMISTNHRRLSVADLRRFAQSGAGNMRCEVISTPSLPIDFAEDTSYAKTIFARFD